ncbi:MAG: hypothetical protein JWQ14_919, partial [Adhaeribacter sp.]|nr:hypothetical protein [Adhaeribacter sp.]
NCCYCRGKLDAYLFLYLDLEKVQELTTQWMEEYNTRIPN